MIYDLIIIGAGPAGLSAAIYAIRQKLKILVLSDDVGGQLAQAHIVDNYLGIPGLLGVELTEKFKEHAKSLDIEIKEGSRVQKITKTDQQTFALTSNKGEFEAKTLIIATGKKYRELSIPGAQEFAGKGISYCATCDAPIFKNKIVAVVGGGDAGQDASWQLNKYAAKTYLLNRYPELRGDNIEMGERIKNEKKIEIINSCYPVEIKGDKFVKSIVYRCNGSPENHEIQVDGIFVEIGSIPVSNFLNNLVQLNKDGEIIIDPKTNMASQPGIFAAGDVTDVVEKQIIIAAGEGAKAALSAYNYLKNR